MKCDRCDNEAIFEIHFIDHEKKRTISLCRDCYFKYIGEIMPKLNKENANFEYFQEIVSDLINNITENIINHEQNNEEQGEKKCSYCGSSISEILANGKFGCSQCFEDFKEEALEILIKPEENRKEEITKENKGYFNIQIEINKKEEELIKLIDNEDYEKAATLRDEINLLKDNLEKINGDI